MNIKKLFDLTGRKAIVTGGGRGLGEQIAYALSEAGADVIVCSRRIEACELVANNIREELGKISHAIALDVSDPNSVQLVVEKSLELFGQIDILVNNAGISWGAPVFDMPLEKWNQVINVNATGTFLMTQALGKGMIERGYGRIINIASVAGLFGIDAEIMSAVGYHASKGAVIALTKDLAVKWASQGVTVNAIAPGFFPTKMSNAVLQHNGEKIRSSIPMGRFGDDQDIKGIAVYLASQASAYMTGQVLLVDGGSSAM